MSVPIAPLGYGAAPLPSLKALRQEQQAELVVGIHLSGAAAAEAEWRADRDARRHARDAAAVAPLTPVKPATAADPQGLGGRPERLHALAYRHPAEPFTPRLEPPAASAAESPPSQPAAPSPDVAAQGSRTFHHQQQAALNAELRGACEGQLERWMVAVTALREEVFARTKAAPAQTAAMLQSLKTY